MEAPPYGDFWLALSARFRHPPMHRMCYDCERRQGRHALLDGNHNRAGRTESAHPRSVRKDTRVLRTYWDGKGPQGTEDHHDRKHVFHVAVGTAIAIYAVGASGSFKQPPPATARTLYKTGIVLVLVMFLALCTAFGLVAWQSKGVHEAKALFYTITISLMLQTIRTVFAVTSAFSQDDPSFNPVTGRVVYQVVFVFLPGALVVSAMITGGALTTSICTYDSYRPVAVPLISRETSSRTVSF